MAGKVSGQARHPRASVRLRARADPGGVALTVTDDGPASPPACCPTSSTGSPRATRLVPAARAAVSAWPSPTRTPAGPAATALEGPTSRSAAVHVHFSFALRLERVSRLHRGIDALHAALEAPVQGPAWPRGGAGHTHRFRGDSVAAGCVLRGCTSAIEEEHVTAADNSGTPGPRSDTFGGSG